MSSPVEDEVPKDEGEIKMTHDRDEFRKIQRRSIELKRQLRKSLGLPEKKTTDDSQSETCSEIKTNETVEVSADDSIVSKVIEEKEKLLQRTLELKQRFNKVFGSTISTLTDAEIEQDLQLEKKVSEKDESKKDQGCDDETNQQTSENIPKESDVDVHVGESSKIDKDSSDVNKRSTDASEDAPIKRLKR